MIDVPSELLRWATAPLTGHRELVDELAALDQQIAHAERFADEDRQFLRFDPSGDGLIVEVLGELASSRHIAVVIPGVGNEIANYEHGLRRSATSLYESASRSDATVIAWLGYDTPDDLLAATDSHPTEAAASLAQMLNGLDVSLDGPAHTSIIGHSYGSLVAGVALQAGARADEVAFVGSPGIGVDHVSDFGLPASIRVWAGRAASDPIQLARGLECLDLIPVCYPSAERLFFGIDPTDPSFGATRFEVGDAPSREAHSSYFRQGSRSLRNLTLIFLGQDQQVARPGS
jgi:pimeloyl-ACP methyl ester carboxylesterase